MRTIKFRAWDKKDSRFLSIIEGCEYTFRADYPSGNLYLEYECTPLEDIELMQFTGLLDKNGKEVFEGDLFGKMGGDKDRPNEYEVHGQVKYDDDFAQFVVELTNGGWITLFDYFQSPTSQKEITGNIYQNPELL